MNEKTETENKIEESGKKAWSAPECQVLNFSETESETGQTTEGQGGQYSA